MISEESSDGMHVKSQPQSSSIVAGKGNIVKFP